MAIAADASSLSVSWWREPTKDQWFAWFAGVFGWMLDAFDFTIFLLIMVPIATEFNVSVTAVASVLTLTLWLRFPGAVGSGWLADRAGRKLPLMLSILWFSACNFIAGFSPNFTFLFVVRALLGIGMGAEWPAGTTLAMESWPARTRGLMGAVMQGSWAIGFALQRGLLAAQRFDRLARTALGQCPARAAALGVHPLFRQGAAGFGRESQAPTRWKPGGPRSARRHLPARPSLQHLHGVLVDDRPHAHLLFDLRAVCDLAAKRVEGAGRGSCDAGPAEQPGRVRCSLCVGCDYRPHWNSVTIIIQALSGCVVAPLYLLSGNLNVILVGFVAQGFFGASVTLMAAAYMPERFPTEVRATASAFCYHFGLFFGALVPAVASYFAVEQHMGFAVPMLIGYLIGAATVVSALLLSPETKGKVFVADLMKQ